MIKFYITFFASLLFVTNYATDIYVNNSGQAGTYTNISAAISASSSGDRIFISPYGIYTEDLVVNKTVTLASAISGTNFNVTGSCSVTANAGMEVRIIGGIFSSTLIATSNNATQNNMTDVYIIDSKFSSISFYVDYVRLHMLFCEFQNNSVTFRNGEIMGCTNLGTVFISDGPFSGAGDTVKIIGNVMEKLIWDNDDSYFFVANNILGSESAGGNIFKITNTYFGSNNNIIQNNLIQGSNTTYNSTNHQVFFNTDNINYSNVIFYNNIIQNCGNISSNYTSYYCVAVSSTLWSPPNPGLPQAHSNYFKGRTNLNFVNGNTMVYVNTSNIDNFDNYGRTNDSRVVDMGSPSIEFYDIDMTINDLGPFGGPYSIDNFINTTNGKARIYDLDIPFEIWSGQTPTVKAKGAHTK
jgi:hypothetical protein